MNDLRTSLELTDVEWSQIVAALVVVKNAHLASRIRTSLHEAWRAEN